MTACKTLHHREQVLTDTESDISNRYQKLGKLQGQVTKWDFSTKTLGFLLWKFDTLEVWEFET